MPAYATWLSRPVFITSTFLDMQAERDHLQIHVFPALAERLRQRFHHLDPIDLRSGVETVSVVSEEGRELLVLKVCLAEITRSRPILIALLGDRYGWIPPAARIEAAAQEAGYKGDVAGKSVTALEIEFGILDSGEQQKLSRFYLRRPLPYNQMDVATAARYSDLHSNEPGAEEAHRLLEALKTRVNEEMSGRFRYYEAGWDNDARKVIGLEDWGRQVETDLWADLAAATADFEHAAPATWQQEESCVLEQFIQTQCRDFTSRTTTLNDLRSFALSPTAPDANWGYCVTGDAGSGKSSLFGEIARRLAGEDVLLLSHAAGISTRSSRVEILLRRWSAQLAAFLAFNDPTANLSSLDDLEKTFTDLLSQAATRTRVVCLIDALNQFERTPTGRHLTWLPPLWPTNARLIATAIPGQESGVLENRHQCFLKPLPPLGESEARDILATVCRRYHQTLHPEVANALLSRKTSEGSLATAIPLWLELAADQLLLLDADDFRRAEMNSTGRGDERLHQFLLGVAGQLPPDVESLYSWMLERAEKHHGKAVARAFTELVALGRTGWRESDLLAMIPRVTGEPLDPLKFITLRRSYRAHLVQRGAAAQWDFSHAQMRTAVERHSLTDEAARRLRHHVIADHLDGLPTDDPLRQSEYMVHLIGADDRRRAALTLSQPALTEGELAGVTRALADHIAPGDTADETGLNWVLTLAREDLSDFGLYVISHRWLFDLDSALLNAIALGARLRLADSARRSLQDLVRRAPDSAEYARYLSVSYNRLGDLYVSLGEPARALENYQQALAISEDLRRRAPDSAECARDLSLSYERLGDLYVRLGEPARALENYQQALAIREDLRRRAPDSAEYARDLSVSYERLGDVYVKLGKPARALENYQQALAIREDLRRRAPDSAEYARYLSVSYSRLGDLYVSLGEPARALENYQQALAISEDLRRRAPDSAEYARDLSVSYERLGDLYVRLGESARALENYQQTLAISEDLRRRAPDSAEYARDLSVSYERLGDLYLTLGEPARALENYQQTLAISEDLRHRAPDSAEYARDLSVSYNKLGDLYVSLGEPARALENYQQALAISEDLRRRAPDSAEYARDLSVSYERLGDLYVRLGEPARALENYQQALAIREDLRRRAPDSAEYARDLSVSYERLGDLYVRLGEPARALENYQQALAISEDLRRRAPDSAEYARDLVASLQRLATQHTGVGNQHAAEAFLQRCRDVIGELRAAGMYLDASLESFWREITKPCGESRGLASTAHPGADADGATRRNLEYQRAKKEAQEAKEAWQALPWWKRMKTKKPEPPEPPTGI